MTGEQHVMSCASPAAMLELAEEALIASRCEGELSLGILRRLIEDPAIYGNELILLAAMQGNRPVALVTMTGRHPALIVGFVEPAVVDFDQLVHAILEQPHAVADINGAARWSEPFAAAWERTGVARTRQVRHLRFFELRSVVEPIGLREGVLREPRPSEGDLLRTWAVAFSAEALDETSDEDRDAAHRLVDRLMQSGDIFVWEVGGEPVSMAAINRRTDQSANVSLVYTPKEHRRCGFASAIVAALSQRELDAGIEWCSLFTDVENPTSNHIYQEVGYEPQCDFLHYSLHAER